MRIVVNCAFRERYIPYQRRLLEGLSRYAPKGHVLIWTDEFPAGSPDHKDVHYAFKLFAVEEAMRSGADAVLWLDAGAQVCGPLGRIWERIERDGVLLTRDTSQWLGDNTSDACLDHFGVDGKHPLVGGGIVGVSLGHDRGARFYAGWREAYGHGLYMGEKKHRWDEAIFGCLAVKLGVPLMDAGDEWEWDAAKFHGGNVLRTGYEH